MNAITPDQLRGMAATTLAGFGAEALFQLKSEAAVRLQDEKQIVDLIDQALDMKYAEKSRALRLSEGKDTGVVHFDDGHVRVTADLPKKAEWDQKQLRELVLRIASGGDNPDEFIETSYRISETKYLAWQESLRSQFTPARTVKVGKATYRLALLSE
jgi:hypothetical protein